MHFSKTYDQLLLSLPSELRDNAVQYRQLKKLINQIVNELSSLGLSPTVLQDLLESTTYAHLAARGAGGKAPDLGTTSSVDEDEVLFRTPHHPKVVYEFNDASGHIEPRLRLWVDFPDRDVPTSSKTTTESEDCSERDDDPYDESLDVDMQDTEPPMKLLWSLQAASGERVSREEVSLDTDLELISPLAYATDVGTHTHGPREVVIPLVSDTEFFRVLSTTLEALSAHFLAVHPQFVKTLTELSRSISDSAHPASSTPSFRPASGVSTHAGSIRVSTTATKSDLYSWREIFQLYVEAEVFESVGETSRGERSVEESEERLKLFAERVTRRGLGDGRNLKLKSSRMALETFLELNIFILNIKKFQFANTEATRKILKKHTKRTALPLLALQEPPQFTSLIKTSLPKILVQAIGETLLPIIPHVDDYACLICTSIAFKPIRLSCGHLFCVRCLVKMQKRNKGDCPMCRAPSVLMADGSNVDWALLNFMQDWFPVEAKEKLKNNEQEAAEEQLLELGLDPHQKCIVM